MVDVWLDISIIRCPNCGKMYVDASWYVVELESDIECGICGTTFNTRKNIVIRALLRLTISNDKITDISVEEYLPTSEVD